ncbi:MAG: HD domain-containing protein [Planctomycetota bacterium]
MDHELLIQEKQHFFISLNTILKNGPLFGFENKNIQEGLDRFFRHKKAIWDEEGELSLRFSFGNLKINGKKIPLDNAVGGFLNKLSQECEPFQVNLFSFDNEVTKEDMEQFVSYFHQFQKELHQYPSPEEAFKAFMGGLDLLKIDHIRCGRSMEVQRQSTEDVDPGTINIRIYFRACTMIRELIQNLANGEKIQHRKLKTLIKMILESLEKDSYYLLALTHCKYFQSQTEIFHLVNTAIFSALIGISLEISRSDLSDLVLCSFLHDIGSSAALDHINQAPADYLTQCRKKDSQSLRKIASIFQTEDISEGLLRSVVVAVECHFKEKLENAKKRSLFSRVISIASDYDRLVTRNPYTRNYKCSPQEALNYLHTHSKNRHLDAYDPALYKIFFQVMGLYPIGSLVQLSDASLGIVVTQQEDLAFSNQPFVRVFSDSNGQKVNEILDLSQETSLGMDRFKIRQTLQFETIKMTQEEYLKVIASEAN